MGGLAEFALEWRPVVFARLGEGSSRVDVVGAVNCWFRYELRSMFRTT